MKSKKIMSKWHELTQRDQLALMLLAGFLFVFFGLYGGWYIHTQNTKNQTLFERKVNDYFWLRTQSNNLKAQNSQLTNSPEDAQKNIAQTIKQAGVNNPVVIQSNNDIQFKFQHSSQALTSKILTQLQQQGLPLTQVSVIQDLPKQVFVVEGLVKLN